MLIQLDTKKINYYHYYINLKVINNSTKEYKEEDDGYVPANSYKQAMEAIIDIYDSIPEYEILDIKIAKCEELDSILFGSSDIEAIYLHEHG